MKGKQPDYSEALAYTNTNSKPADLKITDMRITELAGAPYPCLMLKLYTNQGIVGYGEVRDMASKTYALMLKSRVLGENPCNIDLIFRRIKQFGFNGRQGGGVSGIEMACWDIAGKAYGIPVYQMLGGKFRDRMRIYCDTDADITEDRSEGQAMGEALKRRLEKGYTLLKMDLGIGLLRNKPGMLCAPLGYFEETAELARRSRELWPSGGAYNPKNDEVVRKFEANRNDPDYVIEALAARNASVDRNKLLHPFTGVQITKKGLEYLENYVREVRDIIGYDV
ncbi:MAG: mandelate racemase/muconate lactonizing enzyme family protein, partial [Oscillospiraceae bacterium]|nr:mandelate racemase/muconate lactonizing enzyme family protein [Oscillospiraceae bacterium]